MSLLLSLFSGSGSKNADIQTDIRTGFMGKIPARPDFIRHQAGAPEIKVLDQWVHEGIAYLAKRFPSDWKERIANFGCIHCYLGGDGSALSICGVIRPSQDASGRQHPYIDFATSSSLPVAQSLPYIAVRYAEFYRQGGNLTKRDGRGMDMEELMLQSVKLGRSIPKFVEAEFLQKRNASWAGKTAAEFWESILPDTSAITRMNFARDLLQTLKIVANRSPERIAWGIRLPIPEGRGGALVISFWMSLLVGVLKNQKWRPHVFWFEKNDGNTTLTLFFRSPNASSFAQLICPEVDEGGVVDVVRRPLENLPEITSPNIKILVELNTLSWHEMLENWIKG